MKKFLLLLVMISSIQMLYAQSNPPKREMRGVWVASLGIDWPSSVGTSLSTIQAQKQSISDLFENHKKLNMNAIFFHIRPHCDAVYKSSIEPWSQYLTGTQGVAPVDPDYDPLTVAIEEAHKRGMELHAWLNPYRALLSSGNISSVSAQHVIKKHPEWIIKCSGSEYRFLDPGNPRVRDYLITVIMDIVRRYDLDGIHFDDYFYPYSDYGTFNDDASYSKYKYGFTSKTSWRKNNVNLLLKMINDSIKAVKPYLKFGISPSGNPSVNTGIYCDPSAWLKGTYTDTLGVAHTDGPYIDYILPQLYWVRYNNQLPNWSTTSFLNNRHLYIGHAAYRYSESSFPKDELTWEINKNRSTATINGSVYYNSSSVIGNNAGCADTLRNNFYRFPALIPTMNWKDTLPPNQPRNIRFGRLPGTGVDALQWDSPYQANDGDSAFQFIIYRINSSAIYPEDINKAGNIVYMTDSKNYIPIISDAGNYYFVTATDRNWNEGSPTIAIEIQQPNSPLLKFPQNKENNQRDTVILKWDYSPFSGSYQLQVSTDSLFSTFLVNKSGIKDTFYVVTSLSGQQKYFWKVKSINAVGTSEYSSTFNFITGFPTIPFQQSPSKSSLNININPTFIWNKEYFAQNYGFQLATAITITPQSLVVDTMGVIDTTISIKNLTLNKNYFWRIKAANQFGISAWSPIWGFKTQSTVGVVEENGLPKEFKLMQNYPNPFNPITIINYHTSAVSKVTLKIFDILGNELGTLVNEEKPAGYYSYQFSATNLQLSSGVYFYTLKAGDFVQTRKMVVLK
ncbi:MAG: family 10 glycosylhydrolase [Ignavibacteriales bacterium]|nr:family 10 glycosylhydrolase [Ignavibacteriales bacterium]